MVETGEGRTTFTPKIKTLFKDHAFWVALNYRENYQASPTIYKEAANKSSSGLGKIQTFLTISLIISLWTAEREKTPN